MERMAQSDRGDGLVRSPATAAERTLAVQSIEAAEQLLATTGNNRTGIARIRSCVLVHRA
jgi:hypothetical protein